jgi:hypothetical protein
MTRYAETTFPFTAAIDTSAPQPARFLAGMVGQQLRYGHPSRRRGGPAWALLARRGLPTGLVAGALSRSRRSERPDLDEMVDAVVKDWSRLALSSRLLPASPPDLHALAVRRSAALTVFLFGPGPHPLVVVKIPRSAKGTVAHEARALEQAASSGVTPRPLGRFGDGVAQEGRPGVPPPLVPVRPRTAAALTWPPAFDKLTDGLCALAETTGRPGTPFEPESPVERALSWPDLDDRTRRLVSAAIRDTQRVGRTVLRHGDLSGQNWLMDGDRLGGIVDWETAVTAGAPAFDAWHAPLSWFEQGVGLAHWSPGHVASSFRRAWEQSEFFAGARAAGRRAASAAGVPDDLHDALEVVYYARRLAHRLGDPGSYTLTPATAAAMLQVVCAG